MKQTDLTEQDVDFMINILKTLVKSHEEKIEKLKKLGEEIKIEDVIEHAYEHYDFPKEMSKFMFRMIGEETMKEIIEDNLKERIEDANKNEGYRMAIDIITKLCVFKFEKFSS